MARTISPDLENMANDGIDGNCCIAPFGVNVIKFIDGLIPLYLIDNEFSSSKSSA